MVSALDHDDFWVRPKVSRAQWTKQSKTIRLLKVTIRPDNEIVKQQLLFLEGSSCSKCLRTHSEMWSGLLEVLQQPGGLQVRSQVHHSAGVQQLRDTLQVQLGLKTCSGRGIVCYNRQFCAENFTILSEPESFMAIDVIHVS